MRRRRGAYAIEFALLAPVWLLAAFAVYDLAGVGMRAAALSNALSVACAEAARLDPGPSDVNLPTLQSTAATVLDAEMTAYGQGGCASCTVALSIQGLGTSRVLVCNATAPTDALVGQVVTAPTLTRTRAATLAWSWPAP